MVAIILLALCFGKLFEVSSLDPFVLFRKTTFYSAIGAKPVVFRNSSKAETGVMDYLVIAFVANKHDLFELGRFLGIANHASFSKVILLNKLSILVHLSSLFWFWHIEKL